MHNLKLPNFYSCHKKETARLKTIIEIYQTYFYKQIPVNKQYWTMCAAQTNEKAVFQIGSELGQMIANNLINENQFFGCDIKPNVIQLNQIAKPNANWFCNDFLQQMKLYFPFSPAIVNADLLNLKEQATTKISEILSFLTDCKSDECLLICNVMLNNPHEKSDKSIQHLSQEADAFIKLLEKNQSFCYAWKSDKWKIHPEVYIYNGSGRKAKTFLASFMFVNI